MAEKKPEKLHLGMDVGSVSLNTVLLDRSGKVIEEIYTRLGGQPVATALEVLGKLLAKYPPEQIASVGTTGSGGKLLAKLLGGSSLNEVIAIAKAMEYLHPDVRTVIDIGGEDSKIILLNYDPELRTMTVEDFAMNTICAAGTGSFLDQQAARLGVSIEEEFGKLALRCEKPPRIAGRCSVFAKTDMIHLQQEAAPIHDIVAGLCYALARNFKSNIAKGKEFARPISFQGGVAANQGMLKAFQDVLELESEALIIPKHYASMGAIGAALVNWEKEDRLDYHFPGIKVLEDYLHSHVAEAEGLAPLAGFKTKLPALWPGYKDKGKEGELTDAYIGVDVGSISTNVVAIDENGELLARAYLMTAGRPLEAVRTGVRTIGEQVGDKIRVCGAATTGSGRYLTGDFIGADVVKNEITSQATAAVAIDPTVDTIFEIGGQDSKYISLERGAIVDFEMNKVCAAGTGSFLEEQAEKLRINIKEEFGETATCSTCPSRLGERCTVFMESDLLHHQQSGTEKEDLVAGLSYSIVHNYLNRVVARKKIGKNIFFQGAVAFNEGVVAAFEEVLGRPITVPPNHDVTGAIGCALVAREERKRRLREGREGHPSTFKGFKEIAEATYELSSFECQDCPNHCEVRKVVVKNSHPLYYGSRCEKYNVDKQKRKSGLPDYFREREKLLFGKKKEVKPGSPRVGIPRAIIFHELYPFWKAFFEALDMEVVLSDPTNKKIINQGLETVVVETCFPIKVAHGHIANLLEKKVDMLFLPTIINLKQRNPTIQQSFACPYIQVVGHVASAAFDFKKLGMKVLQPEIAFGWGDNCTHRMLYRFGKQLGKSRRKVGRAIHDAHEAQEGFYGSMKKRGEEILRDLPPGKPVVVIVSRPYNGCDPGINLNLPKKLRDLEAIALPMDFLPLDDIDLGEEWPDMYWRYGQKILAAGEIIRRDERLNAVYITNFGCGPDSFIARFFREKMKGEPYLEIEIDEHSADVGAITRLEAFLDSQKNVHPEPPTIFEPLRAGVFDRSAERTIYIPHMGDQVFGVKAALIASGVNAEIFPLSNDETLEWGRKYTSGKECYPCILTTGDMLRIAHQPGFDPRKNAFFMPSSSGPCRFGQYHKLQRLILDEQGLKDVAILSPNQDGQLYKQLGVYGTDFVRTSWKAMVAVDILMKMAREVRPYEKEKGACDRVYNRCLETIQKTIIDKGDLVKALEECRKAMQAIPVEGIGSKPLIGIVGEIFVRSNEFSNNSIVRQVEALGAEAALPPVQEWFFHVNNVIKLYSVVRRHLRNYFSVWIRDRIMRRDEERLMEPVLDFLRQGKDPHVKQLWANSAPYLPRWYGEAALSTGKSVDYTTRQGVSGIINVMPFTCLPGTITSAVLKRFREDHNNIPCLMMAYDGLEQTNVLTRLEAFMHQARQFKEKFVDRR